MDAEQVELLQTSPLIQRLDRRRIQPGVINLSRYSAESTGMPNWIVQRSALVNQLHARNSSSDRPASSPELALAMASPVSPVQVYGSETSLGSAISPSDSLGVAPSLPIVPVSFSSEPLPISQTTSMIAPASVVEPSWVAPFASENLALEATSFAAPASQAASESISEPTTQYRIRRFANSTIQPAIQRKPSSDQPFPETSLIQSSGDGSAIAPASFPSMPVDDRSLPDSVPMSSVMVPIQSSDSARATTLVLRQSDQGDTLESTTSLTTREVSQKISAPVQTVQELIARPIVQSTSPVAIVQRSTNISQPTIRESSPQKPLIFSSSDPQVVSTLPISKRPLQPSISLDIGSNQVQRRRQSELPLAVTRPFVEPVMSHGQAETIARQETGTAIASSTTPRFEPPSPLMSSTSQISVGQIAEQVSRILFRQLTVERERRGTNQWS